MQGLRAALNTQCFMLQQQQRLLRCRLPWGSTHDLCYDMHLPIHYRARRCERWWPRRAAHRPAGQWASLTSRSSGAGATCWLPAAGLARYAPLEIGSRTYIKGCVPLICISSYKGVSADCALQNRHVGTLPAARFA